MLVSIPAIDAPIDHDFELVLTGEARRLFGIAYTIIRDPHEAEDALQEVMVKAWKAWHKTGSHANPGPWLTRICINHCITARARKERHTTTELSPSLYRVQTESDPDLARSYESLSRQQRAVVMLHYHFGYSLDDCAELMGCRPGTARSHLNRALTTLREVIGNE